MSKYLNETSKFLSYVLRHEPHSIGITLDSEVLLARVESGEWAREDFRAMMDRALTRSEDRALFELPERAPASDIAPALAE